MRNNRTNYNYTPAASSKVLNKKPKPRRVRTNWNQLLLLLFFVVMPILALLAMFVSPMKWVFILFTLGIIALMWYQRGFAAPGRFIITGLYGVITVVMLVSALSPSTAPASRPIGTIAPIAAPTTAPTTGINPAVANILMQTQDAQGVTAANGVDYYDVGTPTQIPGIATTGMDSSVTLGTSASERVLDQFLRGWQLGSMIELVPLTPPSWQAANQPAQQKLFYKFGTKALQSWTIQSELSGTELDDSRTVTVIVTMLYNGREERTLSCDVILMKESGEWYVDPDSLASGVAVSIATIEPQVVDEVLPFVSPSPTPAPSSKTKLYYNADGGSKYHSEKECSSVNPKYYPLASFKYGDLGKKPYDKLEPCSICSAPDRPEE